MKQLLDQDESDPSPSPTVKSAFNLLGTKRTLTRVHFTFPKDSRKLIIEEHKYVKLIPSTKHSTIGNHQPVPPPKPVHSPDICPSPEKPSQDVDKSHLSDSTSTTHSLNETCFLDTSGDHLLHLDSPSLSFELQNTSRVESVEPEPGTVPDSENLLPLDSSSASSQDTSSNEIEFESEGQLDNANLSSTDVFSQQHGNELFLLQKEIDAPSDNLSHQESHACEKLGQDDTSLIHVTNPTHTFALPQLMAQHNCEDLKPTDTPSTVQTFIQAASDHTLNPICAHNPMATQCNQSQYLTLLNKICAHNLSGSQDNQANSLASLCPPTGLWGLCFEEISCRPRGAGFPSEMVQAHQPKFQPQDD